MERHRAWAIAVSTVAVLDALHDVERCWRKAVERPIPRYLYFEILLQARQSEHVTLSQAVPNIRRRADWILKQYGGTVSTLDVLAHLWSVEFYRWMAKTLWGDGDEVALNQTMGCYPLQCCSDYDTAEWLWECLAQTTCEVYNCAWCGWHWSQVCLKCFATLAQTAWPESAASEVAWYRHQLQHVHGCPWNSHCQKEAEEGYSLWLAQQTRLEDESQKS